jgi:DNA-binding transcriptional regulator GbsR (MarR family)
MSETPDTPTLSAAQQQFIERVGLYFEQYQVSRIGGRLLGLLMLLHGPFTLDQMAGALGVSRASVSTNMRVLVALGLVELLSRPGDRRDYYRFAENPWQHGLEARVAGTRVLRRIAEQGLAALPQTDTVARANLEDLLDFCDFAIEDMHGTIARWQARRAASTDHRPRDNQARLIADT